MCIHYTILREEEGTGITLPKYKRCKIVILSYKWSWRARLSKRYDINCFTDTFKHEMWTDAENDELIDDLLAKYKKE